MQDSTRLKNFWPQESLEVMSNIFVKLKMSRDRPVLGLGAHRDHHRIRIGDDPQFVSSHIHVLKYYLVPQTVTVCGERAFKE